MKNKLFLNVLKNLSKKELERKSKFARRMTKRQKSRMRDMFKEGYALGFIARKFKCMVNTVWNNVFDLDFIDSVKIGGDFFTKSYNLSEGKLKCAISCSKLSVTEIMKIRELYHKNRRKYSCVMLGKKFGVDQTTILGIVRGKTFRWVGGWTRPFRNENEIFLTPYDDVRPCGKTDAVFGPKKGSKMYYSGGVLKEMAEKEGVSLSTMCRRMKRLRMKEGIV